MFGLRGCGATIGPASTGAAPSSELGPDASSPGTSAASPWATDPSRSAGPLPDGAVSLPVSLPQAIEATTPMRPAIPSVGRGLFTEAPRNPRYPMVAAEGHRERIEMEG